MLKNYLLVAFRNLKRNKGFSFINILGLAIGMAACLLIIQYVTYELSFDNFHANKARIFRIDQDRYNNGKLSTQWTSGAFAVGNAIKVLPEVQDVVKLVGSGDVLASYKNDKLVIHNVYFASSGFFNVFSFPLLSGDPKTALTEPNTVVISQEIAEKLFHGADAVGKSIIINNDSPVKVTGVMKKWPDNTHMKCDYLASYATFLKEVGPSYDIDSQWRNDGCITYVLLRPGADAKAVEKKFATITNKAYEQFKNDGDAAKYYLKPVQDIHLSPNRMGEMQPNTDGKSVYLLLGIAIFVIIIAWINYINLATARGVGRAKEVGVRKTLGSAKNQLITQFMMEAGLLNLISLLFAFILIAAFLPIFGSVSGVDLSFTLFVSPIFWLNVFAMLLVGTVFSGFYPAIVLSSFKPVDVIKGKLTATQGGGILRKGLVIFQFAASIFLLIGSMTVFKQVQFMQKQDLGVRIDQTVIIKAPLARVDSFYRNIRAFKHDNLQLPEVKSITVSTNVPGEPVFWNAGGIKLVGDDDKNAKQYRVIGADYDYLTAYKMKVLAGRVFGESFRTDTGSLVFTKKAAEQIGFNNPADLLGKRVFFWGKNYTVVGVVDNFHQQSLHDAYDDIIFRCIPDVRGNVSVKVSSANIQRTIQSLQASWKIYFPGDQFDYFFLDQHFNEQYKADQHFGQVFGIFTLIAILVACLGLFGLVSYTIVQRTKEIGIRKVLGASINSILQLLYKDFAWLIVIAFAVSIPIAWYAIYNWLQSYAFRTDINAFVFIIPFITVLIISFTTVSFLTVKAALMNPVKSLKTE
jgi:putative ABC transport system permease protein